MAINSGLKCLILTALFFSGLFVLQAQSAGYFLDPDSEEPRFIQRLAWSGGTYSLHCEVIIEKEEEGEYTDYLREFTTSNYLELSMPPGDYRFRVIPYDILGKQGTETQWESFKVFKAVKPELYQSAGEIDYFNDKHGSKFEFYGNNIEQDAGIYFVNSAGARIVPAQKRVNYNGTNVSLVFNKGQLVDGKYDVFVVNPGGLETSINGIDFKTYREKFGVAHYIAGFSFMPSYQGYGDGLSSGGFLYYLTARIGVISCMFLNNYIGMEFTLSRFSKHWDYNDSTTSGYTTEYNLIFINWLPERKAAVNYKIGVGFDMQPMDLSCFNTGVSFLYHLFQYLNIEAGVIYTHKFNDNDNDNGDGGGVNSGAILPWIGLCLTF